MFVEQTEDGDGLWRECLDHAKIVKTLQKALTDRAKNPGTGRKSEPKEAPVAANNHGTILVNRTESTCSIPPIDPDFLTLSRRDDSEEEEIPSPPPLLGSAAAVAQPPSNNDHLSSVAGGYLCQPHGHEETVPRSEWIKQEQKLDSLQTFTRVSFATSPLLCCLLIFLTRFLSCCLERGGRKLQSATGHLQL